LEGFVNVDFADNHSKIKPDVACDLHKLPFEDKSVDEILSVHVIEHFWRWEVRSILKEWVRVLKPGGKMALECPNLYEACKRVVEGPEHFGDVDGHRDMWVLYGDPKWKDPYMVHRWGYTPATLGVLMMECGLSPVVREAPQYKMGEPRDMRMVGWAA
jgi:SAM-dependent methyltransferase